MFYKCKTEDLIELNLQDTSSVYCYDGQAVFSSKEKLNFSKLTEIEYNKLRDAFIFKANNQVTENTKIWDAISYILGGKE